MTYYKRLQKGSTQEKTVIPEFNEEIYRKELSDFAAGHRPKVLLIGYGTVGKACKAVLDQFGIDCTIWTTATTDTSKDAIFQHDILIHAISLSDKTYSPFLLQSDLESMNMGGQKRGDLYDPVHLSVICDISCDLGNPRNLLPIYDTYTTREQPVMALECNPSIDLLAIPYLPSLEPVVSSVEFSSVLITYLLELLYFHRTHTVSEKAQILYRSYQCFCNKLP